MVQGSPCSGSQYPEPYYYIYYYTSMQFYKCVYWLYDKFLHDTNCKLTQTLHSGLLSNVVNEQKIDLRGKKGEVLRFNQTASHWCSRDKQQMFSLNSTFQSRKRLFRISHTRVTKASTSAHTQVVVTWQHHFKVNRCSEEGVM